MRRRRIGLSRAFSSEASKRATLNTSTFNECSTRMMRFAPTLDRRRCPENDQLPQFKSSNEASESTINGYAASKNGLQIPRNKKEEKKARPPRMSFDATSSDLNDDDAEEHELELPPDFEEVDLNLSFTPTLTVPSSSPQANANSVKADVRTLTMTSYEGDLVGGKRAMDRTIMGPEMTVSPSKAKHSTLPSSFQKYFVRTSTGSTRSSPLWMKPIARLTSFMSSIGNNIDVASHASL